jgi:hypothetical protein
VALFKFTPIKLGFEVTHKVAVVLTCCSLQSPMWLLFAKGLLRPGLMINTNVIPRVTASSIDIK